LKEALLEFEKELKEAGADKYGPRYPFDITQRIVETLEGTLPGLVYPAPEKTL
jgi:hypothetical protein